MKTLLLFILVALTTNVYSQSATMSASGPGVKIADVKEADFFYVIPIKSKGKTLCSVDYGQEVKSERDYGYNDTSGRMMEFNSSAHLLNYFTKEGFEYVDMHSLTYGTQAVPAYLFKKRN